MKPVFVAILILASHGILQKNSLAEAVGVPLGDREVIFHVTEAGRGGDGPILISLHANETTAAEAARLLLTDSSGIFFAIGGTDRRLPVFPRNPGVTIDPNRIFSEAGITSDLRNGKIPRRAEIDACIRFGEEIVARLGLAGGRSIIAMHNNTDGGYSIDSYTPGSQDARKVHRTNMDPDHFYFVTEEPTFEALALRGYNVVLQGAHPTDDGSLSVYCAARGIPYINIEAQIGALAVQMEMLAVVLELLGEKG